jgi:hypothetical protein
MAEFKNLNKKFYNRLIDDIKNDAPVEELFKSYNPASIRDGLEEASSIYSENKDIRDLYENPELFNNVSVKHQPNLKDIGRYNYQVDAKTGLFVPEGNNKILLRDKGDLATLGHEFQHHYDQMSQPKVNQPYEYTGKNLLSKIKEELPSVEKFEDLKGLKGAAAYYKDHFKPDPEFGSSQLKQFLNLKRMVKGEPLKMLAPIALGAAAFGIGEKAYAGDTKGATKDSAKLAIDMATPIGLDSSNLNEGEQELLDRADADIKNDKQIRTFEKLRNMLKDQ